MTNDLDEALKPLYELALKTSLIEASNLPELAPHMPLIQKLLGEGNNYVKWTLTPQNTLCCLAPYIYTWAILAEVDETGFARRWCYDNLGEAFSALIDWKESGDAAPSGYIRAVIR